MKTLFVDVLFEMKPHKQVECSENLCFVIVTKKRLFVDFEDLLGIYWTVSKNYFTERKPQYYLLQIFVHIPIHYKELEKLNTYFTHNNI